MKDKQVQALFLRWLKDNNLFYLFQHNIKISPSKDYTFDRWLKLFNSDLYGYHKLLINDSPFNWNADTQPRSFGIHTLLGSKNWGEIDSEWRDYLSQKALELKIYQ